MHKMWSLPRILCLAISFVLVAMSAWAQGGIVSRIVVEGNQRIEPATVESYLTIKPGEAATPAALDESLKRLFATGLFEDVSIDQQGDALVVKVKENPIINRIAFEGNDKLDDKTLEAEIQLRPRVVYTRARVQNAVQRILELYRRNGRFAAKVEPKVVELDQNRVDLVFEISEGPLTGVGGITFIGNKVYSDDTLRGVLQTKESRWYRFFSSDDTYDPDRLTFDQELLRRFYLARGYADFQVVSAIAELTPDGKEFYITFTIEEGKQYTFGTIDVQSKLRDVQPGELQRFVLTESGDTYDADLVEKTVQSLTDEVGRLGYAFVDIQPDIKKNTEQLTIDLTYQVNEGPRVYVERIDIRGNVRTLDSVIRREFRLAEGDAFNTALLRRSESRLRNLGFFETVEVKTLQGSAPDRVIIDVAVTEKSTGELSFGAGFSTTDGLLGDVRIRERNLLGRGQDLQASIMASQRRQEALISFTEPYFLDRDLAAGFDLFRSRTDFKSESGYDEQSTGGTLRAGYPLSEYLSHQVRYTLRYDEIENVSNDASIFIKEEEGATWTSLVGQTFTYDRRDVKFLPTEGYFVKLDQDVAGLGGDNKFLRHELHADWYYTIIPEFVFNVGISAGHIFGIGGEDVNLANRFFIGGNTFPGFKYGGVGPSDRDTGDSLGGNTYYVGSAELRFPLGLPEELRVYGRAFTYAGTLYDIDVNGPTLEDSSKLRLSAGLGISWLSPLGPLSLDFAQALIKNQLDQTEFFTVNFGTQF